ncbi:hypothetical protein [Chelativorans xinjiangense]|uniref:hypothetical protein n=1 Tax=Chelativorans xinjiangense TaxID=2681485 RepID=UPI00135AD269|nr:hypothetical protein [Chelativorans xinjiangense]
MPATRDAVAGLRRCGGSVLGAMMWANPAAVGDATRAKSLRPAALGEISQAGAHCVGWGHW